MIIKTLGLIGIFLTVFAESGLFFGFFLPGDSLLFIAGLLAATGAFDIKSLILICLLGAILGDSFGYWIGSRFGRKFFDREDSFFFKKKYLLETESFYSRHGKYTIVIARFIPIIRVFAATFAGLSLMEYKTFLIYNIIGGTLWVFSMTLMGYFLGSIIPNPDRYVLPVVFGVIAISFIPVLIKFMQARKNQSKF
ncbi:MAG: VTT domain-containing protein [bacterium]